MVWMEAFIVLFKGQELEINRRQDCPYYSTRARACKDGLYKICAPQRCNRLRGLPKAKGFGDKGYGFKTRNKHILTS